MLHVMNALDHCARDNGYLSAILRDEFGEVRVDYHKLSETVCKGYPRAPPLARAWVTGAFINVINQLSKEGLIESEFHAPRRVIRLSPVGRQIAERILEVEKISANLIQNE